MQQNYFTLPKGQKAYFASDFHLGAPSMELSMMREKRIVRWLDEIAKDAGVLFLVGDLFDFWFEYRHVVPKGYVRFLGKLAELSDRGVQIVVFIGNHDLWIKDYLKEQVSAIIYATAQDVQINGKYFHIAHGDGLDPADKKFRLIKKVFTNPFCQWLFSWLHPDVGVALANAWSGRSRKEKEGQNDDAHLIRYSEGLQALSPHDFYMYGDCHIDRLQDLEGAIYCNLGDWITRSTYARFDGENLELLTFEG
ncbi:hypothetical protein BFP72_14425 [Reichenbachiella sp. 5M10]|uniref:UDP-2,3-diacylglucosamine diphosphatase n=1 Tax=Reichenbachiella sp. 5M10 TaxID=1889772 RepID=UPI000C15EE0A|nr:UDP-2,3-diacylglucosamine diphosphatase [Reichenbachiella sp. 5M10]PIB36509.1 hypothetical protein BFP72_14425 [Reichenbachiella sp. 5M10]